MMAAPPSARRSPAPARGIWFSSPVRGRAVARAPAASVATGEAAGTVGAPVAAVRTGAAWPLSRAVGVPRTAAGVGAGSDTADRAGREPAAVLAPEAGGPTGAGGPAGAGLGAGGPAGPPAGAEGPSGRRAGAGASTDVRPPDFTGAGGSEARSLKHPGLVGGMGPGASRSATSRLCSHTSEPGSPAGRVRSSIRLPVLGGSTVEVASSGTDRPSTLTQVTARPMSPSQSFGFQPT